MPCSSTSSPTYPSHAHRYTATPTQSLGGRSEIGDTTEADIDNVQRWVHIYAQTIPALGEALAACVTCRRLTSCVMDVVIMDVIGVQGEELQAEPGTLFKHPSLAWPCFKVSLRLATTHPPHKDKNSFTSIYSPIFVCCVCCLLTRWTCST